MSKIKTLTKIEQALNTNNTDFIKIGLVIAFFLVSSLAMLLFGAPVSNQALFMFVIIIAGYMAVNIGANDVANNMGPAVGSNTIGIFGAIVIAALAEVLGATIAGKEVVDTIKSGIITIDYGIDSQKYVYIMLASLISAAIWIHLATFLKAPVSTTHSLVGGVLGAGIMAGGLDIVNWGSLSSVVISWVASPLMSGIIAAILLFSIKRLITYKLQKNLYAKRIVPFFIFVLVWCFSVYLVQKTGLFRIGFYTSIIYGFIFGILALAFSYYTFSKKDIPNTKDGVNSLFNIPIIIAAFVLSFAHGANDVSNAIGPLVGIYDVISISGTQVIGSKTAVPFWALLIGGIGIAIGLACYGPRLIRTVGNEITELDKMRSFCVLLSAGVTVLLASQLGLPVSSTHIAVGGIFGVGFLREYLKQKYDNLIDQIILEHNKKGTDKYQLELFLQKFSVASLPRKQMMIKSLKRSRKKSCIATDIPQLNKKGIKILEKSYKTKLVQRSLIGKIIATWVITVPLSTLFSMFVYGILSQIHINL